MSTAAAAIEKPEPAIEGAPNGKVALWIFLGSEVMFFAGLLGTYIVLRFNKPALFHPDNLPVKLNEVIAAINTIVLIVSSYTMALAVQGTRQQNNAKVRRNLLLTALLGLLFCVFKGIEYWQKFSHGILPSSGIFYSCYFAITGIHATHVIGGIIPLLIFFFVAKDGRFTRKGNISVELLGLY